MPSANLAFLPCAASFALEPTLLGGQCFRFSACPEGIRGVALSHEVTFSRVEGGVSLCSSSPLSPEDFARYLDLERDYDAIRSEVLELEPRLAEAAGFAGGIRILRQSPWEALCSFIISQNNNIPRIRSLIDRLCRRFGQPLAQEVFDFPTPERLAEATETDLAALGFGYRASYIIDLTARVNDGRLSLEQVEALPTQEAYKQLLTVRGVGPKVAQCALLYGFGRLECFPVDVWIRRAMEELFGGSTPLLSSPYAGIAQQYVFEYIRLKGCVKR